MVGTRLNGPFTVDTYVDLTEMDRFNWLGGIKAILLSRYTFSVYGVEVRVHLWTGLET